jgi:hypothetical protein
MGNQTDMQRGRGPGDRIDPRVTGIREVDTVSDSDVRDRQLEFVLFRNQFDYGLQTSS